MRIALSVLLFFICARSLAQQPEKSLEHVTLGHQLLQKQEFDKAIVEFEKAIALDAKNALAFHLRGSAQISMGETEKGIADYDEAIRLKPAFPHIVWHGL